MLFPTHLAAGYVLGKRWRLSIPAVLAGAALPDLLDKPLATTGVVDLYQTVGHSLVVLLGCGLLLAAARVHARREFAAGIAAWIGWGSHLALDALGMGVNGRPGDVASFLWPLVRHEPAVRLPPFEFLFHYLETPAVLVGLAIWLLAGRTFVRGRGDRGSR